MTRPILVVSGLPRSGTSMMMGMLEAGGVPIVTDGERTADEDNPKGYFELERVKKLERDASWLAGCEGKAVKIISRLLMHLPPEHRYDVLFMRRSLDEILASQKKMLDRRGEQDQSDDAEMKSMFFAHLEEVTAWLDAQPNFRVKYVSYQRVLEDPKRELARLSELVSVDLEKATSVVDPGLYRKRKR
jgi:hypothetical protein